MTFDFFYYLCAENVAFMNRKSRFWTLCTLWLGTIALSAQTPRIDENQPPVEYEAMQTDYGYFGTTDAIFSKSETIICTFSLTQHKPQDDKIFPTMLSIWLHADALSTKSQELVIKQMASAGTRMPDGQFRYPATLLLENDEKVTMDFSINNLTEDYTHHTVILTAPIAPPHARNATSRYGELATKLRRYDIVSISIAGTTLNLSLLGFHSAEYINSICQKMMLAGCETTSFNTFDNREAADFDISGFRTARREKSIDELVFHALGCFPSDIQGIKPATAIEIIQDNTDWLIDDHPDYHELGFTQEDNYDFTYRGLRIGAEMCWDDEQFTGYNYYFKLYSKDKKSVKRNYQALCDELEILGFQLAPRKGDDGDKEPLKGSYGTYLIETCYYLNIHDEYVIQLQVFPFQQDDDSKK